MKTPRREGAPRPKQVVGVAWYAPEQWPRLLELAVDREELEDTHDAWLRLAGKAMFDLRRVGYSPRKVNVDIEELAEWCAAQNRPLDGSARSEYVAHQLRNRETPLRP